MPLKLAWGSFGRAGTLQGEGERRCYICREGRGRRGGELGDGRGVRDRNGEEEIGRKERRYRL